MCDEYSELDHLRAEIGTMKRFLSELTEADWIERVQYEHRLREAQELLRELESLPEGEDEASHIGTILGILPQSRDFEARLEDGRIIRGTVARAVEDIAAFKQQWENVQASLHFRGVRTNRCHVLTGASP